ncbi:type 2 lantipeptide synthetase LanM, partial [Streptomyces sp. MUM 203J]|uniref:lanthionine synthetase LanC family protein n=1 Tax=Streptomyces sp. MUM 203J TaxID=2791990 RepID=UPI0023D92869
LPAGPGFATGAAGAGWALLRFAEAGGGERYRAGGLAALRAAVGAAGGGGAGADGTSEPVAGRCGPSGGPGGTAERGRPADGVGVPLRGTGPEARTRTAADRGTADRWAAQTAGAAGDAAPDGGTGRPGDAGSGTEDPAGARAGALDGAWCRGRAGIALAVLDGQGALDDPYLAAWAREAVDLLGRSGPAQDDSLCHGETGLLELLGHSALPEARPHWVRRAGALLGAVEEAGPRCGTPDGVPHPGLLTGLAGVGHGLLRAGFPDRIPPVLLLRTPAPPPAPAAGP